MRRKLCILRHVSLPRSGEFYAASLCSRCNRRTAGIVARRHGIPVELLVSCSVEHSSQAPTKDSCINRRLQKVSGCIYHCSQLLA